MFRKRKDPGGAEGFDRISQLIEERQKELAADPGSGDELDDDTILLGGNPPIAAEAPSKSVSLLGVRGPASPRPAETGLLDVTSPADDVALPEFSSPAASLPPQIPAGDGLDTANTVPYPPAGWEADQFHAPQSLAMAVPDIGYAGHSATLVAAEATWEGTLRSEGDIRVEGVVRGEIDTAATLVIAREAQVHGTVRARNIMLAGDLEGDVTCEQRLEILPGGSARGQINSGTLVVHEGAYIDSRFQMRRDQAGNQ